MCTQDHCSQERDCTPHRHAAALVAAYVIDSLPFDDPSSSLASTRRRYAAVLIVTTLWLTSSNSTALDLSAEIQSS